MRDPRKPAVFGVELEWCVWLPPLRAEHREGDALVGPAGETYFATSGEACAWLSRSLAEGY